MDVKLYYAETTLINLIALNAVSVFWSGLNVRKTIEYKLV